MEGSNIKQTSDKGYIICGLKDGQSYLLKIDSLGTTEWSKTFSTVGQNFEYSVEQTYDGGYIVSSSDWGVLVLF